MNERVTLVIPGRNCEATLEACLDAALPLKRSGAVSEIVFVDDGSTDGTRGIASRYDVALLTGPGRGAAAARNVGWRHARSVLVWFVDSDCVIEPGALERLLVYFADDGVGAVGGSYANRRPASLLACLIHEEIVARHQAMPSQVDFLGGFNVIYRRTALETVGGFDERFPGATAEDADLSFRVHKAGFELRLEPGALVGHFHETRLLRYLRTQRQHGIWRVRLHLIHRQEGLGNSYSGPIDHLQPALALMTIATLPLLLFSRYYGIPVGLAVVLLILQMPMTWRLVHRTRSPRYLAFAGLGFLRSFWRGAGMLRGLLRPAVSRG